MRKSVIDFVVVVIEDGVEDGVWFEPAKTREKDERKALSDPPPPSFATPLSSWLYNAAFTFTFWQGLSVLKVDRIAKPLFTILKWWIENPNLKTKTKQMERTSKDQKFPIFSGAFSALMPLSGIDQFRMEIESLDLVIVF